MMELSPFNLPTLSDDPATVYALDADLRIQWVNRAWGEFARANGATWADDEWGVGARVMDAVPAVLRRFYASLFAKAQSSPLPVEHDYECSSPDLIRRFRMRVMRAGPSGLLVVNSLMRESAAPRAAADMLARYETADGLVVQCSHCRRTRRREGQAAPWDWVPEYVARPNAQTSHGLCKICAAYHYAE